MTNENDGAAADERPLEERVREGLRMFEEYLQQPPASRALGTSTLLASAQQAHEQLEQLTRQTVEALPPPAEGGASDQASALMATQGIPERVGMPFPHDIAAWVTDPDSTDPWAADASARYTGFVVAALTAQEALLDNALTPQAYVDLLLKTARELKAAGEADG